MGTYESKEELYDVLDETVAKLQQDEGFKKRIARTDASCAFIVPELDARYALYFNEGQVQGRRDVDSGTTIRVSCDLETLDRMLSGKLSGTAAYYQGKIRLYGDEWRAETMAGYLRNISEAYNAVKN
ncbi:MAG: SCP2 sterol-binding domain-containing protein [Chloroflexota bacterium]|nr:SCP2 sterol-binding domain-containing protein [Chloroflexota bacterium]